MENNLGGEVFYKDLPHGPQIDLGPVDGPVQLLYGKFLSDLKNTLTSIKNPEYRREFMEEIISDIRKLLPEETSDEPPLRKIGTLLQNISLKDGKTALAGDPVYEENDKYHIYMGGERVNYYKKTLHPYIKYEKESL